MAADKTPRRLGRGLDALLGTAPRDERTGATPLQTIPVDLITANPFQPRRDFAPEELQELKDSLQSSGLLQPITVRPAGRGYQLIAGERRWRAAQSLGWKEISAIVRQADDQTLLALALVENLQRSDLNPLDEAVGYRRLTQEFGLKQDDVAKLVGKSRSTVANYLRLLDLPAPVQSMLRSGEVTAGQVRPLLTIGDQDKIVALAGEIRDRKLPARAVEQRASPRAAKRSKAPQASTKRDPAIAAVEDALRKRFQTDVRIETRRGGGGEIHVRFYSNDDLERVVAQMGARLEP